ncbi:MAG: undecaprenyldiphospho-muramoylpentapeptide beta-N-acetylglucosaminyltransferase [Hyphomicrobiaceae bacterium]|nr:undecaprenyldiphospho-muramoylpentapeptide beta-N-acetylglucosaminyltransferase [Hyphomicrobiaceae bacterium]
MSVKSVMLAAGGTGGHLFPAFALAQELGRRGIAVDLVTDMRGDRYGTDFPARAVYRVPSATISGRSLLAAPRTAIMLARGVWAAYRLIADLKPACVIGFGGYPAFPPIVAATLRGIPTALHEQNAVLGRANRLLLGRVSAIATSFEQVRFLDGSAARKARFTGNPVRDQVVDWATQGYPALSADGPFSLLVFGGSQGARFLSEAVPQAIALLPEPERRRLFVVQQCRPEDLKAVEEAYRAAGVRSQLAQFFANLPEEMAKAHLVIARSGASTVAELTVIGRPALLVPLPHAVDNDQLQNARRLAESGGAWCIEQKDMTAERLAQSIGHLMSSPQTLAQAAAAAKAQGRPDAVERLADLVEELIGSATKSS